MQVERSRLHGFTLLEVMVALAIMAVAALGLLNAQNSQVKTDQHLANKTFAHWVALNRLAELRLQKVFPEIGEGESTASMAGREWKVTTKVQPTPVANVRLVTILVGENSRNFGEKPLPVTSITGFLPRVSSNAGTTQ
jgi:general secretion pathway protein I